MEPALKVINQMVKDEVISDYAVGGAVALLFYTEPALTYDLDVFVFLPKSDSAIIQLTPIYEYLKNRGYAPDKEHVVIESIPVQFIPVYNPLVEEAVREAVVQTYNKTTVRVLRLEYLMAIMLDTGRPKDQQRISQIIETISYDKVRLKKILDHFGLSKRWEDEFAK